MVVSVDIVKHATTSKLNLEKMSKKIILLTANYGDVAVLGIEQWHTALGISFFYFLANLLI